MTALLTQLWWGGEPRGSLLPPLPLAWGGGQSLRTHGTGRSPEARRGGGEAGGGRGQVEGGGAVKSWAGEGLGWAGLGRARARPAATGLAGRAVALRWAARLEGELGLGGGARRQQALEGCSLPSGLRKRARGVRSAAGMRAGRRWARREAAAGVFSDAAGGAYVPVVASARCCTAPRARRGSRASPGVGG